MSISKNSQNLELDKKRHSMAHLLAAAVGQMFPETQYGVGPVIENGCYYDFILPRTLIPEDLPLIEAKMKEMLKRHLSYKVQEISLEDAIVLFEKKNQPLKVELLNDLATRGTTNLSEEERESFGAVKANPLEVVNVEAVNIEYLLKDAHKTGFNRVNVGAVIRDSQKRVLLCKRSSNKKVSPNLWHIPGGKVEEGESILDALKHEIKEELSINLVKIIGYTGINGDYTHGDIHARTLYIEVEVDDVTKIELNHENSDFIFADKNTLQGLDLVGLENEDTIKLYESVLEKTPNIRDVDPLEGVRAVYEEKFTENGFTFPANKDLKDRAKEMSQNMTKAEQLVWFNLLESNKTGFKWTKQKVIDNYIVDFYCHTLGLVVEIDGDSHSEKQEYDEIRTKFLNNFNIDVVRFSNDDVYNNFDSVNLKLKEITNARQKQIEANLLLYTESRESKNLPLNSEPGESKNLPLPRGQNPEDFGGLSRGLANNLPTITIYRIVDESTGEILFEDLCKGPHVGHVKELKSLGLKLDKFSGSYWRGDQERNIQMQRIYALVYDTKEELVEFIENREEAKKRDHRVLNETQKYYTISELVGAGLPLFQPNGMILRKNIQDYLWQLHSKKGYKQVWTPHIAKEDLYITSGHAAKFGDELFRVQGKTDKFIMKPMNCPHHMQLFADNQFSYRDMPIRYFEHATVYRDEKPGQLSGFTRVRSITQDDGHLFCRVNQIEEEVSTIVGLVKEFYDTIGMESSWVSLSVRDPNDLDKYLGTNEVWNLAESSLENAAKANNLNYRRVEGEAAFYGPKLDFMFKDAIGREWQLATIQCDFNLPERFDLSFVNEKGEKERPVVIHRAISGSSERFLGVIIDHFGGRFPFWMSPKQVKILTINDAVLPFVKKVEEVLSEIVLMKPLKYNELRYEVDNRSEGLGKKIRDAELEKIPVILIVGPKDVAENQVSVRTQEGESKVKLDALKGYLMGV